MAHLTYMKTRRSGGLSQGGDRLRDAHQRQFVRRGRLLTMKDGRPAGSTRGRDGIWPLGLQEWRRGGPLSRNPRFWPGCPDPGCVRSGARDRPGQPRFEDSSASGRAGAAAAPGRGLPARVSTVLARAGHLLDRHTDAEHGPAWLMLELTARAALCPAGVERPRAVRYWHVAVAHRPDLPSVYCHGEHSPHTSASASPNTRDVRRRM